MSNKSRYWKYEFIRPRPGNICPGNDDDDGIVVVVILVVVKLKVTKIYMIV